MGVSTVSRAINNHPDINEETKQKVLETIQKYNYVPNNSARNLKRSDSNTIAVLVKGISNPFFSEIVQVFEREITKQKYSFVCSTWRNLRMRSTSRFSWRRKSG